MDDDEELLRQALAASLAEHHQHEQQTREAIRSSRVEYFDNQPGAKRKAVGDLQSKDSKRVSSPEISPPRLVKRSLQQQIPQLGSSLQHQSPQAKPRKAKITYPNGALRITRTPGRQNHKNCVNLEDVIQGKDLISACCFSFFIADEELFQHLPLSHTSDDVPIYIGRDANIDPMAREACSRRNIGFPEKFSKKEVQSITPTLEQIYREQHGKNYHAFWAWSRGSSHSKILFLVYPNFARIVITSCNLMDSDTILSDNHWYIHDLPTLSSPILSGFSPFEMDFLDHLQALNTPEAFLSSIRGRYDYSAVKVHLITSAPGVYSGQKAENHGLLRLRRVVQDLKLSLQEKQNSDQLQLDLCAASIGNLSVNWLNNFNDCAMGKETITLATDSTVIPKLRIFYPTVGDVRGAIQSSQDAASNIGCHMRPWPEASSTIRNIFHHYESKDKGRLFHQKLILAWNRKDPKALPYFVYVGSANLSQSAWGALEADKRENKATCNTKLVKLSNFECGVVVPGYLIADLLEEGTKDWQTGIVPFDQTCEKYNLSRDIPWNDPRWAIKNQQNQKDF